MASVSFAAQPSRVAALLQRGDALDRQGNYPDALTVFLQAEKLAPRNPQVVVRISEESSNLMDETHPHDLGKLARNSFSYAKRAVALDPKSSRAHLALAIAYGRMTDFVSNKTKIQYSRFIRDEALMAIKLNPKNDLAWHVLGRWNFGIQNVNFVLKFFVKMIYGGLPHASNAEAIRCLRKAVELAPDRIINHTELADIYNALGKKDMAREQWKLALKIAPTDQQDRKAQSAARKALE